MEKNNKEEQIEMEEASLTKRRLSIIESLLYTSGEPLKLKRISEILELTPKKTAGLMDEIKKMCEEEDRGIQLIVQDDEYQFASKIENSSFIKKLLNDNSRQSLSQASLETLAIIAYKQPITRIAVDEIRGVKSDRAITNLLQKKLILECGRLDVPGRPILYGTTENFLKAFGITDLKSLPPLDSFEETAIDEEEEEN